MLERDRKENGQRRDGVSPTSPSPTPIQPRNPISGASLFRPKPALEATHLKSIENVTSSPEVNPPAKQNLLQIALSSAALWSGTGASVACMSASSAGAIGQALVTAWSLRNELHNTRITTNPSTTPLAGSAGLAMDLIRSPGFSMLAAGGAYLTAAVQAGAAGHLAESLAFSSFIVAQVGATALSNGSYTGTRTSRTKLEVVARQSWSAVPTRLQDFLRNPGPWYAAGNITLVLSNLNLPLVANQPLILSAIGIGVGMASVGLVQSLARLVRGTQSTKGSGFSSYLNGAGSFFLGIGSFLGGSPIIGTAQLCWSVSNSLLGRLIGKKH